MALLTLYNKDLGIHTESLTGLARLVGELSGVQQPSNRPVTGTQLFEIESGIIATWARNVRNVDRTESLPYLPELVGQVGPRIVLGKGSGIDSIKNALTKLGVQASEEDAMKVVMAVKEFSLKHKRLLTDAEFRTIVDNTLPKVGAGKDVQTRA